MSSRPGLPAMPPCAAASARVEVALDEAAQEHADAARQQAAAGQSQRRERKRPRRVERGGGGEGEWPEHERREREQRDLEGLSAAVAGRLGAAAHAVSAAARGG